MKKSFGSWWILLAIIALIAAGCTSSSDDDDDDSGGGSLQIITFGGDLITISGSFSECHTSADAGDIDEKNVVTFDGDQFTSVISLFTSENASCTGEEEVTEEIEGTMTVTEEEFESAGWTDGETVGPDFNPGAADGGDLPDVPSMTIVKLDGTYTEGDSDPVDVETYGGFVIDDSGDAMELYTDSVDPEGLCDPPSEDVDHGSCVYNGDVKVEE